MLSTTYLADYHFLTFHGGALTRWHQERLGDTHYFVICDAKLGKHVLHRNSRAFHFLVVNGRLGPRIEVTQ